MAHVFEHVLFHAVEGFPDIAETLKELGAEYNGSTSFDRTNFYETVSASDENLETAIRLEAGSWEAPGSTLATWSAKGRSSRASSKWAPRIRSASS